MRILGIDPGLRLTGYGCIEPGRSNGSLGYTIVEAGVFRLVRGSKPGSIPSRLDELEADFGELLDRVSPEVVAIEGLFAHYKHPATAVTMAHARGVLMLRAHRSGARLIELKPAAVKKSLTGSGRAGKAQMQQQIQATFGLAEPPSPPDVADALAIALCALRRDVEGIGTGD